MFHVFEGEIVDRPEEAVEVHVLKSRFTRQSELVQRIAAEYQGMEKISHPGVARILDIDFYRNVFFIVKERSTGHTLESLLERGYAFSTLQAVNIATQVARLLGHAHKEGVKYRSLTPSDLVIGRDLKVKATRLRMPRSAERGGDERSPGPAADLLFLGCLLHDLLGGGGALSGEKSLLRGARAEEEILLPAGEGGELPPARKALRGIVYRAVARDPSVRYAHYDDFLKDLGAAAQTDVDATEARRAMELAAPETGARRPAPGPVDPAVAALADAPEEMLLDPPAGAGRNVDFGDDGGPDRRILYALGAAIAFLSALVAYIFW